jgi:hypothetical protein
MEKERRETCAKKSEKISAPFTPETNSENRTWYYVNSKL